MARLQVLNGKRQGAVYDVAPGTEVIIGHRQSANITIDDPWVSWDHARLFFNGDGHSCWIEDLGSTNGTYVNCVRVKREQLRHEDIIFLGKTHVIFLSPTVAGAMAASPFQVSDSEVAPGLVFSPPSSHIRHGGQPALVPSPTASPFPGDSSHNGPFAGSASGVPPLPGLGSDPFASTGSRNAPAPMWAGSGSSAQANKPPTDPFKDSSVDPFSSGPDYDYGREVQPTAFGANQPLQTGGQDLSFLNPKDPDPQLDYLANAPSGAFPNSTGSVPFPPAPGHTGTTFPVGHPSGLLEIPSDDDDPLLDLDRLESDSGFMPFEEGRRGGLTGLPDLSGEPSSEILNLPIQAQQPSNPFAETRGDEQIPGYQPAANKSLSLSDIQNDGEPDLPGPSSQDIADILEASGRDAPFSPQAQLAAVERKSTSKSTDSMPEVPASELRTRELDTNEVNEFIAQQEAKDAAKNSPSPTVPPPTRKLTREELGTLAYENARLQDEVRRLRGALQAAQQRDPNAVRAAAQALRDQELGHLARRVAELEQQLAHLVAEKEDRESELNLVTDDMIDKEDTIDQLRHELQTLRSRAVAGSSVFPGAASAAGAPRPPPPAPFVAGGGDDLSSLEF